MAVNLKNSVKDGKLKNQQQAINQFEIGLNKIGLTKQDDKFWRMMSENWKSEDVWRYFNGTKGIINQDGIARYLKSLINKGISWNYPNEPNKLIK